MLVFGIIHSLGLLGVIIGVMNVSWWTVVISLSIYMVSYTPGHGSILRVYLVEILPPPGISIAKSLRAFLVVYISAVIPHSRVKYGALTIFEILFFCSALDCLIIYFCVFETGG